MDYAGKRWTARALVATAIGVAATALSGPALSAVVSPAPLRTGVQQSSDQGLIGFYRTRAHQPLWTAGDVVHPAAAALVEILRDSPLDGFERGPALARSVEKAIERARSGEQGDLADAELVLSSAWIDYVRALRRPVDVGMTYAPGAISPEAPFSAEVLRDAAAAADLAAHLRKVSELNPVYKQLRDGLVAWRAKGGAILASSTGRSGVEKRLLANLDRARALPIPADGRFLLVDAASANLYLYEDGRVRDSMRVIVGKPSEQTPMVAGVIRHAVLNPYWNVPPDLVRKKLAAGVLTEGTQFLASRRYEVLSDWSDEPSRLDPAKVDWKAVAAGTRDVRVRQLPGGKNAMGDIKFMFANDFGVYLHDTPDKALFAEADRRLSSGCVRVEDAKRLAGWLFGNAPRAPSKRPEQAVALSEPMPVYITYLTANWDGERLALGDDGYDRDASGQRLAATAMAR